MGISELLKIIKDSLIHTHISEFRGKIAAVDMLNWIYRGVYSCSADLNNGMDVDLYLNFPLKMLSILHSYKIDIIAVFDGNEIIAKEKTDRLRKDEKNKNLQLANKHTLEGNEDQARTFSRRAMKITGKIVNTLIEILKKMGIRVIVSPYEADSQISYLALSGLCDFVISEDSDLIAYGCKKVLYKMGNNGEGWFYDEDLLYSKGYLQKYDSFRKLNPIHKKEFCVLIGCDYLPSLKGIGPVSLLKLFDKEKALVDVVDSMKDNLNYRHELCGLTYDYVLEAKKSVLMFMLQTVYDPIEDKLKPVNEKLYNESLDYITKSYGKSLFKTDHEKRKFFGESFDCYSEYCNGMLDVKKRSIVKDLESNDSIVKYYNKYSSYFRKNYSNDESSLQNKGIEFKRISLVPVNIMKKKEEFNDVNVNVGVNKNKNNGQYKKNSNNLYKNEKNSKNDKDNKDNKEYDHINDIEKYISSDNQLILNEEEINILLGDENENENEKVDLVDKDNHIKLSQTSNSKSKQNEELYNITQSDIDEILLYSTKPNIQLDFKENFGVSSTNISNNSLNNKITCFNDLLLLGNKHSSNEIMNKNMNIKGKSGNYKDKKESKVIKNRGFTDVEHDIEEFFMNKK